MAIDRLRRIVKQYPIGAKIYGREHICDNTLKTGDTFAVLIFELPPGDILFSGEELDMTDKTLNGILKSRIMQRLYFLQECITTKLEEIDKIKLLFE